MKIALDTGPLTDGNAGRGIGAYTNFLKNSLLDLAKKEKFEFDAIDVHATKDLKQYNLLHYPSFDFFQNSLHVTNNVPVVVTIHDTIPLIYPSHYPAGIKGTIALFKQKRALSHASAVITDSETSKKDIIRFLNVPSSKIFPIYLGPTVSKITKDVSEKETLRKHNLNFPYLLYIGDVNWNKNLVSLARACELKKLHLVIAGKRATSDNFDREHIENKPLVELQTILKNSQFVHATGFVSTEDLPVLIKNATLLCQPSYYEGFGLSVLDAMSLGVPTVCARTQALVELYETGSVFFDPYNIVDMGETLQKVFQDKTIQENLIVQGAKLSKKFTWSKTAQQTFAVYQEVLLRK